VAVLNFWPVIDARVRVIAICMGLVIVGTAWAAEWWRLLGFTVLPVAMLVLSRTSWKSLALRISVVSTFLVLAGFFAVVTPKITGQEGNYLNRFIFLFCATIFSVSSVQLVAVGSSAHATIDAIRRLGMPHDIVWMTVLALRYLPLLKQEGARIHHAARARLWSPGKRTMRVLGWMSASLFIRAFERALRTAQAMEARGFGSSTQKPLSPPLAASDILFLVLYPGVLLAIRFTPF
jgi:energy-coupling factor transporter transmembrane protein EcfT